jgi:hypothetical protein
MNFEQAINIEDLHRIAKRKLPKIIFAAWRATRPRFTSTGSCRSSRSSVRLGIASPLICGLEVLHWNLAGHNDQNEPCLGSERQKPLVGLPRVLGRRQPEANGVVPAIRPSSKTALKVPQGEWFVDERAIQLSFSHNRADCCSSSGRHWVWGGTD